MHEDVVIMKNGLQSCENKELLKYAMRRCIAEQVDARSSVCRISSGTGVPWMGHFGEL